MVLLRQDYIFQSLKTCLMPFSCANVHNSLFALPKNCCAIFPTDSFNALSGGNSVKNMQENELQLALKLHRKDAYWSQTHLTNSDN